MCGLDFVFELADPPAVILADFALGIVLAWPIDLLTTFAWRDSSSTSACNLRRCDSSSTNRAMSTFTPRRSQFSWTRSGFSSIKRLSSITTRS